MISIKRIENKVFQGVTVMVEQLVAVLLQQGRPGVFDRNGARPVVRWPGALIGHFEKEQAGELLDVFY